MFVRNAWYTAAWADEVTRRPLARRICNEPLVLFRDAANRPAALLDMCCHRGAPLSLGEVTEEGLQCAYHGLVYDRSGRCVQIPGQRQIPSSAAVRSYPVVEKDAMLWIWVGDADKPDPSKIMDYPYHTDPRWPSRRDVYHVKCNYLLLVDNLMDPTHVGYVHRKTIGGDPKAHVGAKFDVERSDDGVKLRRLMLNMEAPPTYVKAVGFKGRIDRWQEFEYIPPGTVLLSTGAVDAGAYERGVREGGYSLRLFDGLTPETESTCWYFWSTANGYRRDEPEAADELFRDVAATFREDQAIVEAQQARLDERGENALVNIASDAARLHIRRILERMA
jgi:phenylpropionate dioxygenase-like ring-hydroxylating dioxygenase large terminal subunit